MICWPEGEEDDFFFLNSRRGFTQPIVVDVYNQYHCEVNYH